MKNSNIYRWFGATIALLLLIMPVLLTDELSLLANWLLTLVCWLIIIIGASLKIPFTHNTNDKPKGHNDDFF